MQTPDIDASHFERIAIEYSVIDASIQARPRTTGVPMKLIAINHQNLSGAAA